MEGRGEEEEVRKERRDGRREEEEVRVAFLLSLSLSLLSIMSSLSFSVSFRYHLSR